jgi:hypothetical protein
MTRTRDGRQKTFWMSDDDATARYWRVKIDSKNEDPNFRYLTPDEISISPYDGLQTTIDNGQSTFRYPDIGFCIYCGSRRYSIEREKLGGEHIIPESISGKLYLGRSSCKKCEAATSSIESKIFKELLLEPRERLNLNSKKSRLDKPKLICTFIEDEGEFSTRLTIEGGHATTLILPQFLPPNYLSNAPLHRSTYCGIWIHTFYKNEELLAPTVVSPSIDLLLFCQMLAKIAHTFAYAKLGPNIFSPWIGNFVRKKYETTSPMDSTIYEWVGGIGGKKFAPSKSLHELALGTVDKLGKTHIVVFIRLFATLGAPVYQVIVGEMLPHISQSDIDTLSWERSGIKPEHRRPSRKIIF